MSSVRNISPPSARLLLGELRGAFEPARLLLRAPLIATLPRGHGAHVIVLPGYGANETSTATLQAFLRLLGYRSHSWGIGRNTGNAARILPQVIDRIEEVAPDAGSEVHLVGWSLGGYIAREVAREHPARVRSVITLGSPVIGGPKYTTVAARYRRAGHDLDEIERLVDARYDTPLCVPVTAIYSKTDGIVAWEACIDRRSDGIEHVEVRTTHIGLGFCPEVYRIVADRLARHSKPRH
ncbi:MAG: alpha/beta fold hydrolase [Vicinamibacterales bacterium]